MPTNYQGNSNKDKEPKPDRPEKKMEKIVTGEVIQKKPPLGRRVKSVFFGGDFNSAVRYVAADVLLPALRNLVFDTFSEAGRRLIFGDSVRGRRGYGYQPEYRSVIHYDSQYRVPRELPPANLPDQARRYPSDPRAINRRESNLLLIQDRKEAESVVETMMNAIEQYDVVTVADLHELIGHPSVHTDNKWGWTRLSNVEIRQTRDGYLIDLPAAEPI